MHYADNIRLAPSKVSKKFVFAKFREVRLEYGFVVELNFESDFELNFELRVVFY